MAGWLAATTPFPGNDSGISEAFDMLFTAKGSPKDWALFSRTGEGHKQEIWLLSPEAGAAISSSLPGTWAPEPSPQDYGWSHLIGHSGAHERFGLRSSADVRRGE